MGARQAAQTDPPAPLRGWSAPRGPAPRASPPLPARAPARRPARTVPRAQVQCRQVVTLEEVPGLLRCRREREASQPEQRPHFAAPAWPSALYKRLGVVGCAGRRGGRPPAAQQARSRQSSRCRFVPCAPRPPGSPLLSQLALTWYQVGRVRAPRHGKRRRGDNGCTTLRPAEARACRGLLQARATPKLRTVHSRRRPAQREAEGLCIACLSPAAQPLAPRHVGRQCTNPSRSAPPEASSRWGRC